MDAPSLSLSLCLSSPPACTHPTQMMASAMSLHEAFIVCLFLSFVHGLHRKPEPYSRTSGSGGSERQTIWSCAPDYMCSLSLALAKFSKTYQIVFVAGVLPGGFQCWYTSAFPFAPPISCLFSGVCLSISEWVMYDVAVFVSVSVSGCCCTAVLVGRHRHWLCRVFRFVFALIPVTSLLLLPPERIELLFMFIAKQCQGMRF